MSTYLEVEAAARRLSVDERQRLLLSLAAGLRAERSLLPALRSRASAETEAWIEEDERDLADYYSRGS